MQRQMHVALVHNYCGYCYRFNGLVLAVRKAWENLRRMYTREKDHQSNKNWRKRSIRSSDGTMVIKQWRFYPFMTFLDSATRVAPVSIDGSVALMRFFDYC